MSLLDCNALMARRCSLVIFCRLGALKVLVARSDLLWAIKTSSGIHGGGAHEEGFLKERFLKGPSESPMSFVGVC